MLKKSGRQRPGNKMLHTPLAQTDHREGEAS